MLRHKYKAQLAERQEGGGWAIRDGECTISEGADFTESGSAA